MPQIPRYEKFKSLISKDAFLSSFELLNSVLPKKVNLTKSYNFISADDFAETINDSYELAIQYIIDLMLNFLESSNVYFLNGYNIVTANLTFGGLLSGLLLVLYFGTDIFKLYITFNNKEYEFIYNKSTLNVESYYDITSKIMPTEDIQYMISKAHLII